MKPLIVVLLCLCENPAFDKDATDLGIPFERFTTKDSLGRTITGYLSKAPNDAAIKKLPVILYISGSGSQSNFFKHDGRIHGSIQNLILSLAKNRARVLVVEKGVRFLDAPKQPATATEASKEFLEEHTLPRWGEANVAALKAVIAQPGIDGARVLVTGHSEGGIVAARVAAELPKVTHVAPLGCGGATQLYSLAELARGRAPDGEGAAAMERVYADWGKILTKPKSIEDFWMAHPYRRWSSFLRHSVIAELKRSKAKIYLAHGTADEADAIQGFDMMRAELLAHGRDVIAERIEGGDYGFSTSGTKGQADGMQKVFGNVIEWFFR